MIDKSYMNGFWQRISILLAFAVVGCTMTPKVDVVEVAAEVEAREIAFAATMADRDLESFLTFLSPEAIFFNGGELLRGPDEILQAWGPLFDGPTAPFSWHPDMVEVLESGGLALSSGPVVGATGEEIGRFNSIWRKDQDKQWRIVFDKGSD
jgi:ketosteroid isomerase-like protein